MKISGAFLLAITLCGCGSFGINSAGRPPLDESKLRKDAEAQKTQIIHSHQQTLSLPQLILQRRELCQISAEERARLLEDYHSIFIAGGDTEPDRLQSLLPKRRHQLNALMLATCDPAQTSGLLSEMLAVVTAEEHWPEEYMAFFDLLVASHSAYSVLNDKQEKLTAAHENLQGDFQSLETDYERLQTEHENTIKGISDIERGIDIPGNESLNP